MHIVIASAFDPIPSDGVSLGRYHFLATALIERGHTVTYLCSQFMHTKKVFRSATEVITGGIRYIKVPTSAYASNNAIARLLNHFKLGRNVKRILKEVSQKKQIDLIICASPPLFWGNAILKFSKKNSIKSVLDIQDNWPKALESVNGLLYKTTLNALPLQVLKTQNINLADAITAVSSDYISGLAKIKGRVFYLGAPIAKIQEVLKNNVYKPSEKIKLVFLGNTSTHKYLLLFLNKNADQNIEVNYIGECNDERIKNHQLIRYHGRLYDDALFNALSLNDYGLFINDTYKQIKMPNKLFYYWGCGLPVLGIDIHGEALELIKTMGGLVFNNEMPNMINLKKQSEKTNREEIKQKALKFFDEKIIYKEFTIFLEQLAKK